MSTQTVYFNDPAQITNLEQTQPLKYMNSVMSNISETFQMNSKRFHIEIAGDGTLKIVPTLTNTYSGSMQLLTDGRQIVTAEDYQSAWYVNYLYTLLSNPIDTGALLKGWFGDLQTYGELANGIPATYGKLTNEYTKMRLREFQTKGKIPPMVTSIAKAFLQAANDAYGLLNSNLKTYVDVRQYEVIDMIAVLVSYSRIFGQEKWIGSNFLSKYWLNFLLNINGFSAAVAPLPNVDIGLDNNSGFPNTASAHVAIGKDYISNGKCINIGSYHWYNYGTYALTPVWFNIPSENLFFQSLTQLGLPGTIATSHSSDMIVQGATVGAEADNYYIQVKLEKDPTAEFTSTGSIVSRNDQFTSYYIGNTLYPIEYDGPIKMTIGGTGYQMTIPRTKYGPIFTMNTSTGPIALTANAGGGAATYNLQPGYALCILDPISEGWLEGNEAAYRSNWKSVEDVVNHYKKYGEGFCINFATSAVDNKGYVFAAAQDVNIRADTDYCKRIEQNIYSPTTDADINWINYTTPPYARKIVDGSDADIFTSFCVPNKVFGKSDIDDLKIPQLSTNAITTAVQHSNSLYIDQTPLQTPDLDRAVLVAPTNGTFLLQNMGTISPSANLAVSGTGYLEATRTQNTGGYMAAMRQIMTYPVMRSRNINIWYKVYSRLGLVSWSKANGYQVNQSTTAWANPTPMTMASAQSIYTDFGMQNVYPFWNDLVSAIKTGAAGGINWTKPYFNTNASAVYPYVSYTGSVYASNQTAINTALPGVVSLFDNFDPTNAYSLNATGTFVVLATMYRAMQRFNILKANYTTRAQAQHNIFAGKTPITTQTTPGYGSDSHWSALNQAIAVNEFNEYQHVLPNFATTATGSYTGVWSKTRELTTDDQWRIFINRMTYPNGFSASKQIPQANPSQPLDPQTPIDLIMDALVDALVDIGQIDNSWILSYVNADNSVTEVTSTATTLLEKASRTWGSVNTIVFPYDMDSTGNNLRLYPIQYGQERQLGTALYQYYDAGNFSYIPSLLPSATGANTNNNATNGTTAARRIFNPTYAGNGPNSLYKNGYVKQGGGSAQQRILYATSSTTPMVEQRYSLWSNNPITTFDYRGSIRYMQTNTLPTTGDSRPTQYTFNSNSYDRNTFNTGINVKPLAASAGII